MGLFGWSAAALAERSGLAEWELEALADDGTLADWPAPHVIQALAHVFHVPVRDVVLHAAAGCGLPVDVDTATPATVALATSEDLMREVRRRLALGAANGGYLAVEHHPGAANRLQFS